MLIPTKKILTKAQRGNYAVAAFNINNMEIASAVIDAAEAEQSPVIIQTSEGAIQYAGMDVLVAITQTLAKKASVPIALHLDHGKDMLIIKEAIRAGYQSVMYDGSDLEYHKNVENTKLVVAAARKLRASVEAELGALAGIEDLVSTDARDAHLTDPTQAHDFARQTKCDFLAVAVGTSHGAYKFSRQSALDHGRLAQIRKKVRVPLVLHGASSVPQAMVKRINALGGSLGSPMGVSNRDLRKSVAEGICKVNTDTDLRLAFTAGVRGALEKKTKEFDPRKILTPAYEEMVKTARWKMRLLGSSKKV